MKKKIKDYSLKFIKEIIPVVAGILIALFINNWNDERKDRLYIEQVFSSINSELKETNEDIKQNLPLQKKLIDSLQFYANNKSANILDIVMKSGGVHLPNIKINAWKSVSNSKIDLLDYKKITALSDIEETKDVLNFKSQFLANFLYSNFYETDKRKKETLKMLLLDIIQTEKTTQQYIEDFTNKENIKKK